MRDRKMTCCQKAVTEYIIQEALLIRSQDGGSYIADQMIRGADISTKSPEDQAIIKSLGKDAIEYFDYLENP